MQTEAGLVLVIEIVSLLEHWPNTHQPVRLTNVRSMSSSSKTISLVLKSFCCFNNAERRTAKKKQSKSSTSNMPLNLLMLATSPYSSSLQLAIKPLMGVDLWCSCSAGQVPRSRIKTCSSSYFQSSDSYFFLLFAVIFQETNKFKYMSQKCNFLCVCNIFHSLFLISVVLKHIWATGFLKMALKKKNAHLEYSMVAGKDIIISSFCM